MFSESTKTFVGENHHGVLTTFRRSGAAQMSIILCAAYGDGVAFTTPGDRAKLRNLRRDPRCTLIVSQDDWGGYVVFEGLAKILEAGNTDADKLSDALREVYRGISGEHPDWDEYDRVMLEERRAVVIVVPEHVYGTQA